MKFTYKINEKGGYKITSGSNKVEGSYTNGYTDENGIKRQATGTLENTRFDINKDGGLSLNGKVNLGGETFIIETAAGSSKAPGQSPAPDAADTKTKIVMESDGRVKAVGGSCIKSSKSGIKSLSFGVSLSGCLTMPGLIAIIMGK